MVPPPSKTDGWQMFSTTVHGVLWEVLNHFLMLHELLRDCHQHVLPSLNWNVFSWRSPNTPHPPPPKHTQNYVGGDLNTMQQDCKKSLTHFPVSGWESALWSRSISETVYSQVLDMSLKVKTVSVYRREISHYIQNRVRMQAKGVKPQQ